jgi:hypothetical protein
MMKPENRTNTKTSNLIENNSSKYSSQYKKSRTGFNISRIPGFSTSKIKNLLKWMSGKTRQRPDKAIDKNRASSSDFQRLLYYRPEKNLCCVRGSAKRASGIEQKNRLQFRFRKFMNRKKISRKFYIPYIPTPVKIPSGYAHKAGASGNLFPSASLAPVNTQTMKVKNNSFCENFSFPGTFQTRPKPTLSHLRACPNPTKTELSDSQKKRGMLDMAQLLVSVHLFGRSFPKTPGKEKIPVIGKKMVAKPVRGQIYKIYNNIKT